MTREIHKISAVVIENDKIFMVKKKDHEQWTTLGGKPENNETEQEALTREVDEEIHCEIKIIKKIKDFIGPAAHNPGNTLKMSAYLVELQGKPNLDDPELEDSKFISKNWKAEGVKLTPITEKTIFPYLIEKGYLKW